MLDLALGCEYFPTNQGMQKFKIGLCKSAETQNQNQNHPCIKVNISVSFLGTQSF